MEPNDLGTSLHRPQCDRALDEAQRKASSAVEVFRRRALDHPNELAYTFLVDGESEKIQRTYAQMDRWAGAIAARLQELGAAGERALLIYDPGLDYVAALVGCLYAGVVAVPAYPPDPMRMQRTMPRLQRIVRDSQASLLLTTTAVQGWGGMMLANIPGVQMVLATDEIDLELSSRWVMPRLDPSTLALLQYTSGSTGSPKGVMVNHGNLLANMAQIHLKVHHPENVIVSWLPAYHDMGLIGLLQAWYSRRPMVLLSPLAFFQRPVRWLRAITEYRGTISPSPNFGYDLCVRKIGEDERRSLDLSSWAVAMNGAEPVRHRTIERFADAFASCGMRRQAFYPCYGMAETTLMVSGGQVAAEPVIASFQATTLEDHRATPAGQEAEDTRKLVGCGQPCPDTTVTIVDPETCVELAEGRVGEIWISGPNVAQGYWGRPQETEATFRARTTDGNGPFLRTGDLGFLQGGDLFVTGRLKDLIIFCGANHYPQDIEATVERCHPDLKPYGGAAFSVDRDGRERLVVVHEVGRPKRLDLDAMLVTIRRRVGQEHQIPVDAVVLISQGTLPKTSSGKTQRGTCRQVYLAGHLNVVAQWQAQHDGVVTQEEDVAVQGKQGLPARYVAPRNDTERLLADAWADVLGVRRVGIHDDFFDLGGNSLLATQLVSRLAPNLDVDIPLGTLFERRTVAGLAALITQAGQEQNRDADLAEMLDKLESITDAEAERMLAEEGRDPQNPTPDGGRETAAVEVDYLVIGAGPAGLQMGFYLQKARRDFLILERADGPGAFFKHFPRHRKLLSINKIHTGYDDPEVNLRWDWNSLLSDHDDAMTFKHFSQQYFPDADDLVRYLDAYAGHYQLPVKYNTQVARIRRDGRFHVVDTDGNAYTSRVLIVATGCSKPSIPDIPGIEYGERYNDMLIDPEDFAGQRVLILGKGNSALETANHLLGATSLMHLASPHSLKMAWRTHFVGHIRSVNNSFLDSYLLKSQNALLDAQVMKIQRRGDKLVATMAYSHASGEVEELVYDRVLVCTGFRFDDSIFDPSCRPTLAIDERFPEQTCEWESTSIPDLYFAGTVMQMRDFKKKQSAFIHGFRYNIDLLHRILEQKYHGRRLPYRTLSRDPGTIVERLVGRADRNSSLWQQTGFCCDLLVVPPGGGDVHYYEDLAVDYVHEHFCSRGRYYTLTMEFGQERVDASPDVFAVSRIHKDDTSAAALSTAIHPIVRRFEDGALVNEHHVMEDLASEFHEDVHVQPLLEYFTNELAQSVARTGDRPKPKAMERVRP